MECQESGTAPNESEVSIRTESERDKGKVDRAGRAMLSMLPCTGAQIRGH